MEVMMDKNIDVMHMKVCSNCQRMLPLSAFGKMGGKNKGLRNVCKKCHNNSYNARDIKGKLLKESNIMPQEELMDYLYNKDKEIDYTIDDLIEEIKSNGRKNIASIQSSLEVHDDLLMDVNNKNRIKVVITNLILELNKLI